MILWWFTEKSDFYGGVHEKPIYKGELPKKVRLGEFADLEGAQQNSKLFRKVVIFQNSSKSLKNASEIDL